MTLTAKTPCSFNTVVKDITGSESLSGYDVYKAYKVYNYDNSLSVDLSDTVNENSIDVENIDVLIYKSGSVEKCKCEQNGNTFLINESFDAYSEYKIYFVKSNIWGTLNSMFNSTDLIAEGIPSVSGSGLVYGSMIKNVFLGESLTLWFEDLGDYAKTSTFKDGLIEYLNGEWAGETGNNDDLVTLVMPEQDTVYQKSNIEISIKYNMLKELLPIVEYDPEKGLSWYHALFLYSYCGDVEINGSDDEMNSSGTDIELVYGD